MTFQAGHFQSNDSGHEFQKLIRVDINLIFK
jgi:hypothetical protein